MPVNSSDNKVVHTFSTATQIVNIIVKPLFFKSILTYIELLWVLIHMRCDTYSGWYLHSHHPIFGIYLIVVLLFLFLIFHNFSFECFDECK